MVKNDKTVKLNEEELQDQTMTAAPAVPATDTEVADASVDAGLSTPVGTEPTEEMTADGSVPAVDETAVEQPETFTAPLPGYVPSGWVDIKNLASAVAQETGDVEAASTAPDAQAAVEPETVSAAPSDVNVPQEQPLVAEEAEQEVQPQFESLNLTNDEIEMILEYRKYQANKMKEEVENPSEEVHGEDESVDMGAGAPEVVPTEPAPLAEAEEVCPECGKAPCECEEEKMVESEEVEVSEDMTDPLEEVDGDVESVDVVEEAPVEDIEEEDIFGEDDFEDDDLLSRISAFLDDETEEGEMAHDVLEDTADFLDSLFDEEDEFDDEEVFDDEEEEVEAEDEMYADTMAEEDFEDEELEESKKTSDKLSEGMSGIVYPAGSAPRESYESEDNLVEAYKRESAKKREALFSYRQTMKESNFGKALSSSVRLSEEASTDKSSWRNNRFEEKVAEHDKLNFSDLLNNGLLG